MSTQEVSDGGRPTRSPEPATDVIVVGGGLAGLAAAATAARAGRRVVLVEGQSLGGRAQVDRREGFTFNRGPRALYLSGAGVDVLADLGVPTDRGGPPAVRGSMALHDGGLDLLPQGPVSLARTGLLSWRDKVAFGRTLSRLAKIDVTTLGAMTADEWIASLGLGHRGQALVRTLVRLTTYVAATDLLDAPSAVAQLQVGVARRPGVRYLDGGWQSLVDGLAGQAEGHGAEIRTGVGARRVETADDGGACVTLADGTRLFAGTAVVAAGGPDAVAALLDHRPPGWDALGPPATVACLELGLHRPPPTRLVLGVDEPLYLSTHAPPADLAPEGGAVVHLMRYQRPDEALSVDEQRAQLWDLARRAGITDADVAQQRFLARMVVTGAIPTAAAGGLLGRVGPEVAGRPGIFLAGDWVGPIGLLGDAALASGAAAGRRAAERTVSVAVP